MKSADPRYYKGGNSPDARRARLTPERLAKLHASRRTIPLEGRFFEKVDRDQVGAGCWEWTAARRHFGYGVIWLKGRLEQAHRVSWMIAGRELPPKELCLDHMCRNPACVNPNHLRIVTYRQNGTENNDSPLAINARKTHCRKGHPLEGDNIAIVHRPGMKKNALGQKIGRTRARMCLTCFPAYRNNPNRVA